MPEQNVQNKGAGNGLAWLLIGAWAVVLLAAFLWKRGSDIGHLPSLMTNLGGGPLFGSGLLDSAVGLVVSILILQAWLGTGRFVCSYVGASTERRQSGFLQIALWAAIGAGIWSLIFFFLGRAGAYSSIAGLIALVIGNLLLFIPQHDSDSSSAFIPDLKNLSAMDWTLLVLVALPLAFALIASLAPPIAKDTLLYHFALPKAYIAQHSNAFVQGNVASYLPLGAEMHFVWAMLVGGLLSPRAAEAAAGGMGFWFFVLLVYAVYGWARELGLTKSWALVGSAMVATIPSAYHVSASGYVDVALSLVVLLAVYSLSRWWQSESNGWLILMAVCLGSALSIKLTTVFIFAAFALLMLLRARDSKNQSRLLIAGVGSLVLTAVLASPWYLRTWKETGSPVFPFYMSIWKGQAPGWDVERSNLFQAMNSQYGGADKTAIDYALLPWNVSTAAQPEVTRYFDGVIGVGFLFGLPILVWALWKFDLSPDVKICAAVAGIMFLLWLSSSQQIRYLLPVLPLLSIGIVAACDVLTSLRRSLLKCSLIATSFMGLLTVSAWFCQAAPLRVVLGGESRDQYLTRNLDYYPYYHWLNTETQPDEKVWLINMRRDTYNLDRPVVSDYLFEDWTLRKMIWESRSTDELRAKVAAMGVRYVLTRHDFLFDFENSTLVDERKSREENESKLRIAREFILDPARTLKSDEKFSLIKVF